LVDFGDAAPRLASKYIDFAAAMAWLSLTPSPQYRVVSALKE
jgi:hypothetical protein